MLLGWFVVLTWTEDSEPLRRFSDRVSQFGGCALYAARPGSSSPLPYWITERRLERAGADAACGAQAEGRAPNGRAPGEANPWNEERSDTVGGLGRRTARTGIAPAR